MSKLNLSAVVVYTTTHNSHRLKTVTYVRIRAGETDYATRHLSGRYSQEQALTEFRRFPSKFNPTAKVNVDTLKALAKVA